ALPTYQDSRSLYHLQNEWGDYVSANVQTDGTPPFDYTSRVNTWGDTLLYGFSGPDTVNGQTAAADAFVSIYGTRRMFNDIYLRDSWDDLGGHLHAYVHVPEGNAHPGGDGIIYLGYMPNADGYTNVPLTDIETVAHEVAHTAFLQMTGVVTGPVGVMGGL